jgi:pilus assembly protein Flp/PilA
VVKVDKTEAYKNLGSEETNMKKFLEFLRDEEGQTSTEYILLVAVAAMLVFKFKDKASGQIESLTDGVFGKANDMLGELQ